MTVYPIPILTAVDNTSGTLCNNSQTNITVSDLILGAVVRIIGVTISGAPGNITGYSPVNSTFASGSSITDLLVNTTTTDQTIQYDFQSTANGCSGNIQSIIITVRPNAVFSVTNIPSTVCEGALTPSNIIINSSTVGQQVLLKSITATGGVTGVIPVGTLYSSFPVTLADVLDNPTNVSQTITYEFEGSLGGACINPTTQFVTVTVSPKPEGANDTKMICSDLTIGYNLLLNVATLGNNVGSTFTWVATDNANVTGENTAPENGIGPIITDILTNLTNVDQVVQYTVTPTGTNGCIGSTFIISITVKPEPVGVTALAPQICSGTMVAYDLQANVNGPGGNVLASTFTWIAAANPDVTGESTSIKTGSIIDDVLVNTTTADAIVVYTVIPTSQVGGCIGNPFTISVRVNPKQIFSAGPDLAVCVSENDILIDGSVTFANSTYSWSGGTFDNATLEKPRYILSAADKAVLVPTNRTLSFSVLGSGACPDLTDQMVLTINPLPVVVFTGLPPGSPSSLAENSPPITLTGNLAGGTFTITPATSVIGSTFINVVDRAVFDPSAAELGSNFIRYTFTNVNGCTNFNQQEVFVNPVTTVDFAIQGAVLNAVGEFEICAEQGLVKLLGFPVPSDGFPPETRFTPEGPNATNMTIVQVGQDYFIQTTGLPSDTYRIRYTFKNQFDAITFRERTVRFFAAPVSAFSSANNCIVSDVVFTDISTINPSPFPAVVTSWEWAFGDNTFSTNQNPSKRYAAAGTYNVSLKVTTSQGCADFSDPFVLRVGDVPEVDFSWSAICNNDNTNFQDKTTKVVGSTPPGISVITAYSWDFGDGDVLAPGIGTIPAGTHGGRTFGTYKDPQHKYVTNGTYVTNLNVDTNDGCSNSKAQNVFILPYTTVTPVAGAEYLEDFEGSDGGWIAEAFNATNSTFTNIIKSDTSWIWGPPTGATINNTVSGSNVWWTGANGNSYFQNENSVVDGPCFDLTSLLRPMVTLDYYSDSEKNIDGAVLQYSINGGLTWRIVGPPEGQSNRDEGINWFNGVGILSNPGTQAIGNYGWTDKQTSWKNARFNLDMIPVANRSQVRLRIAFASNDGNDPTQTFDGFAFDNFFVGEKARNVLVEHFTTSTLNASVNADTYLNGLYQQQLTDRGTSDFQHIQYHVNFAGVDPLNRDNPADPAARALYFGASQPPYTIMDGILIPGKFTGVTNELNKVEIDRRALVEPPFTLTLKDTTSIDNKTISVKMVITAKQNFNSPLIINVALVEKSVGTFQNVLRKNLFGSAGETVNLSWVQGQILNKVVMDVPLDVPISDPNGLLLIGYVQDKNTKEIYQSIAINGPVKTGDPVVGVDDEPVLAALNSIQMFPNPANQQFTFGLPAEVHPGTGWRIIDQRGFTVLEGDFTQKVNGKMEVSVADLPNAVYFVVISSRQGAAIYKKLVVMNRN